MIQDKKPINYFNEITALVIDGDSVPEGYDMPDDAAGCRVVFVDNAEYNAIEEAMITEFRCASTVLMKDNILSIYVPDSKLAELKASKGG